MKFALRRNGDKKTLFWVLVALLAFLLACIHRNWLFSLAPLISGDWPYFSANQLQEWFPLHELWIGYDGLGRGMSQGNFALLFSVYGWLAQAGLIFEIIARLLFFLPVVVLAPYGAYLAVNQLARHRLAAIVGAFVYSLNTYFLVIQGGHMHLSMVYALAPFAYYFALKETPRAYFWQFTIIAIMGLYDVRMTLVVGGFSVLIALWRKVKTRHDLGQHARKIGLGLLAVVMVHSFWILPTIFTASGPFTRDVFAASALNWVSQADSLTLHHPFWSVAGVTDFMFQPAPYYMFFLPLVAFVPFTIPGARFRREMLFFGGATVVSIVLLMQENSLFKEAYQLMYNNLPLMSMFRESTKLFFITAFCYSVLIGLLIAELSRRGCKGWAAISGGVVIVALIIPAAPYLTGLFIKAYKKEPIPAEITAINQIISDGPGERTLWVSRTPKFAASSNERPSADALDLGQRFWSRYSDPFDSLSYLKQPYTTALLNFAGVDHVVVPHESADSVYNHYNTMPAEYYQTMVDRLELPGRREVGPHVLWENPNPKPHFYIATDVVGAESLHVYSGIDTQPTAAYLFTDQQSKTIAEQLLDKIATNTERNPFQPKYMRIADGQITSTMQTPTSKAFDLYQREPSVKTSQLTRTPNFDTSQAITQEWPGLKNLYPGGELEAHNSFKVSDCNNFDKTTPEHNGIGGELTQSEGRAALQVTARRHTACFSKKIETFDPNAYYFVGLDYQYQSGPAPQLGLYPYIFEPFNRQIPLPADKPGEWTSYQTIIGPNDFSDEMFLNVYIPAGKQEESKTLFDNIRVYKLPYVPQAYLRTNKPALPPADVQHTQGSPTHHRLTIKNLTQPRLFVFSETFDPNWRLSVHKVGDRQRLGVGGFIRSTQTGFTLGKDTHLVANGFANGWWIDPNALPSSIKNSQGEYELVLEYMPQRWFYIGLGITGLTVAVCTIYVIVNILRVKPKEEGKWRWQ